MKKQYSLNELVAAAIRAAGGPTPVGKAMGVSPRAVSKWRYTQVPATKVVLLERLTGGRFTRYELRPDIFSPSIAEHKTEIGDHKLEIDPLELEKS